MPPATSTATAKDELAGGSPSDSVGGIANAGQVEVFLGWNGPGRRRYDAGDTAQATGYVVDPPWCGLSTAGEQFGFVLAG